MPAASNFTWGCTAADNLREVPIYKIERSLFRSFTLIYSLIPLTARTLGHTDILPAASLARSLAAHAFGLDYVC